MEILPAAVTESVGVARFNLSAHGSASNSLEGFGRFAGVQAVDLVPTVSLDWLAGQFAPPDVIKIDVEGAEACVLRGGSEMLARHRPVVVCEVGAECRQEVSRLLRAAGYLLYNPKTPAAERVALDEPSGDILAVPVAQ